VPSRRDFSSLPSKMTSPFDYFMEVFHSFRLGNRAPGLTDCLYINYIDQDQYHSEFINRMDLPPQCPKADSNPSQKSLRIVLVSDTHQRHGTIGVIPKGDIFIHAGDILMTNRMLTTARSIQKLNEFNDWLSTIDCPSRIVICGNHDKVIEDLGHERVSELLSNATYLQNSFVEINSIRIWGSPLSSGRSDNSAFQSRSFARETLKKIQAISEEDERGVDILVTHGPNHHLAQIVQPKLLHVWGHAHGAHGLHHLKNLACPSVNASIMNTKYDPHQLPIVIDFPLPHLIAS
jgi:hypothetical protein